MIPPTRMLPAAPADAAALDDAVEPLPSRPDSPAFFAVTVKASLRLSFSLQGLTQVCPLDSETWASVGVVVMLNVSFVPRVTVAQAGSNRACGGKAAQHHFANSQDYTPQTIN